MKAYINIEKYPKIKDFIKTIEDIDPDEKLWKDLKKAGIVSETHVKESDYDHTYAYTALTISFVPSPEKIKNKELRTLYSEARAEAKNTGISWVEVELDGDYI